MAFILSAGLKYVVSRRSSVSSEEDLDHPHALKFIRSPVDPKAYAWLHHRQEAEEIVPGQIQRSRTVAQFEAEHNHESTLAKTIFRKQHEAHSLELFFDLFFVANLAVFTDIHAHVDGQSVANYIGFFSLLWTTWFHTIIYDVRFFTDSIFTRLTKLVTFGVMASMVGLAAVYSVITDGGMTRAYAGLALVFMAFRFMMAIMYAVVLYFVWGFHKTLVPLALMIGVYIVTGFAFLITYLVNDHDQLTMIDGPRRVIHWYIIIAGELLIVILISSIWRVLSFKHTHLVERVGLLTLIILGEGILGMTKSFAYDVLGTNISIGGELSIGAAAVVLIYVIYVLYFNNIHTDYSEDQFGSIRQQVWALLHYPLHVAVLLTVEGQTALIVWNACRYGIAWFDGQYASVTSLSTNYDSSSAFVEAINNTLENTAQKYHYYELSKYYNAESDLSKLSAINATFRSDEWNDEANDILRKIQSGVEYFIFSNFQAEGTAEIEETADYERKVELYNESFKVVFEYFYIAAGGLLIMLAVMAWFGRTHKRTDEYFSIGIRMLVGLGLPWISLTAFYEEPNSTSSFRFYDAGWLIPVITFAYLCVLTLDNLSKVALSIFRFQRKKRRASRDTDVETAYRGDPEIHQKKLKQIYLEEPADQNRSGFNSDELRNRRHDRNESHDSDNTLRGDSRSPSRRSKGYTTLQQHDVEDDHDVNSGQRTK